MNRVAPLIYREIKQMVNFKIFLLNTLLSPVVYLLFFAFGIASNFGNINYKGVPINYVVFLLPGLIAIQSYNLYILSFASVSTEKRLGVLKILLISKVKLKHYIIAKISVGALIVLIQALLLISTCLLITGFCISMSSSQIALLLTSLIMSSIAWCSLGISLGSIITDDELRNLINVIIGLPLMFSSSAFYNLERAPLWVKILGMINPITYTSNTIRDSLLGLVDRLTLHSFIMLLLISITLLVICINITKRVELL